MNLTKLFAELRKKNYCNIQGQQLSDSVSILFSTFSGGRGKTFQFEMHDNGLNDFVYFDKSRIARTGKTEEEVFEFIENVVTKP